MEFTNQSATPVTPVAPAATLPEVPPVFDLAVTKSQIADTVKTSPEVMAIAQKVDINNAMDIVKFGAPAAESISTLSDKILGEIKSSTMQDSGVMLKQLNTIMSNFDLKEFEEHKDNVFDKLFHKSKDALDKIFKKYDTMGGEIEKISVSLKQYQVEIEKSNDTLDKLFSENMRYYTLLQEYIAAGEMCISELGDNVLPALQAKVDAGDAQASLDLNNATQAKAAFEQRVYDLKLADNVAMQALPAIQNIKYSNVSLIRKINSAFVITLPIFKQCIIQAIMLKRQKIQAESMSALDEATNKMLLQNAQNTASQSVAIARMASGSSVDIAVLQQTWSTIVNGIEETKKVQEEASAKRIEGEKVLLDIKNDFDKRFNNSGTL